MARAVEMTTFEPLMTDEVEVELGGQRGAPRRGGRFYLNKMFLLGVACTAALVIVVLSIAVASLATHKHETVVACCEPPKASDAQDAPAPGPASGVAPPKASPPASAAKKAGPSPTPGAAGPTPTPSLNVTGGNGTRPGKAPGAAGEGEGEGGDDGGGGGEEEEEDPEAELGTKYAGLYNVYEDGEGSVYLAVDRFEVPFVITALLSKGDAEQFLLHMPATDTDHNWFQFRLGRFNNTVELVQPELEIRVAGASELRAAYTEGVWAGWVRSFSVYKELDLDDGGKAYVIEISNWIGYGMDVVDMGDFAKGRVARVAAFPHNLNFIVEAMGIRDSMLDEESTMPPLTGAGVTFSLGELPEVPMKARRADSRVGFFTSTYTNLDASPDESMRVSLINRWRLEKKDPTAAVSEPIRPITYHVDPTVPERWRPYIKKGVENWQKAFDAAGWPNAIRAVLPGSEDWPADYDAGDIRYSSISWAPALSSTYALGPHDVDPRTGEILNADIVFTHGWIRSWTREYSRQVAPAPGASSAAAYEALWRGAGGAGHARSLRAAHGPSGGHGHAHAHGRAMPPASDPAAFAAWLGAGNGTGGGWERGEARARGPRFRHRGRRLQHRHCERGRDEASPALLRAALLLDGALSSPADEIPEEYIGQALVEVAMHEVGHTLGLRHNFKASTGVPWHRLNDPAFAKQNGISSSVMDYHPANIQSDRSKQGDYYTRTVGVYDVMAISYGYSERDGDGASVRAATLDGTVLQEPPRLKEMLAGRAGDAAYGFSTDEDGPGPDGWDPHTSTWDLSSDPIAYYSDLIALCAAVRGEALQRATKAGGSGPSTPPSSPASAPRWRARGRTSPRGRGAPDPVTPVPPEQQRRALDLILQIATGPALAPLPAEFPRMVTRVGECVGLGIGQYCEGLAAPSPHLSALEMRMAVLRNLLGPARMLRLRDVAWARPADALTIQHVFDRALEATWGKKDAAKFEAPGTPLGRDLAMSFMEFCGRYLKVLPLFDPNAELEAALASTLWAIRSLLASPADPASPFVLSARIKIHQMNLWADQPAR
eukprot:tig00020556_g11022.t1